jgi:integrase
MARSAKPATGRRKAKGSPGEEYIDRPDGSSIWQIDFSIEGRRFRRSSGHTEKAAAAALALKLWQEAWDEIKLGVQRRQEMTINEACIRYYSEVCEGTPYGERSQKYNMDLLVSGLGKHTLLSAIDDDRVANLARGFKTRPAPSAGYKDGLSPATINRYLTTLSVVCKRAAEVWGVSVGPWNKKKHMLREPKGREVFLDHAQARKLLNGLCGHARPIVLLDLMTGLRRANVTDLRWEQISLDLGRAVMVQKGDRPLSISLVPDAIALLASVQPDPAKRKGPVWVFGNPNVPCSCPTCSPKRNHGRPIKSIRRAFATAAKGAGLRDDEANRLRFHDLRHTYASWLLAEGGDLKLVQDALQHANIATTARYAHLIPGRKEQVIGAAVKGLFAEPEAPAVPATEEGRKAG